MDELGHLGWVAHQSFELAGLLFGIRTNSPAFGRWLAEALPATLVQDEEAEPNYSVIIGGDTGGVTKRFHILYRDSTVLARTFDLFELVEALLADLEALTYWRRTEAVYVQATFLSRDGIDALFPEEIVGSFAGLRRAVHARGLALPESRYVAVDLESGVTLPLPHRLEVDQVMLAERADVVGTKPTLWPRARIEGPTPIELVCTMGPMGDDAVRPVSRGWALYVLSSNARNLHAVGGAGLEALGRLIRQAICWEIGSQEPRQMIESVVSAFRLVGTEATRAGLG
jgi:hypothetical protein